MTLIIIAGFLVLASQVLAFLIGYEKGLRKFHCPHTPALYADEGRVFCYGRQSNDGAVDNDYASAGDESGIIPGIGNSESGG